MRSVIGGFKLSFFILCTVVLVPLQAIILVFTQGKAAYFFPWLWHVCMARAIALKVTVKGKPYRKTQTLYVSNHISYLDITAIGTVLRASFVAKSEVQEWGIFGFLAKLQQTAFISRSRHDAMKESESLEGMLDQGKSLIVFPEGTSTDGRAVMPFKSSLFALPLSRGNTDLMIQPFTVRLVSVEGQEPEAQQIRDIYAWHLNMDTELADHLWAFFCSKGAHIELTFHDPIAPSQYNDRKTLAKDCYEQVSNVLTQEKTNTAV